MTEKLVKFGGYPAEYNPAIHGPYDPARYYGKRESIALDVYTFPQLQLIIILYNLFVQPILRFWT